MRYSLARGESVFLGWRSLNRFVPLWFIVSTFIPWSLPGIAAVGAEVYHHVFPTLSIRFTTIAALATIGTVLTLGKTLYTTMEHLQRTVLFVSIPFILGLAIVVTEPTEWATTAWGLIGRGDGWWFFPPSIALASFLGAFAYSGAGGNLNLAQSHYVKEKGFGMGKYAEKITSLLHGGAKSVRLEGTLFPDTPAQRALWRRWWRLVNTEHALIFWGLGLFTILLLVTLAHSVTAGLDLQPGLAFLYAESQQLGSRAHPLVGTLFLIATGTMLFTTQLGVLESSSRTIAENVLLLRYKPGRRFPMSLAFYVALWGQIVLGSIVMFFGNHQPQVLLTAGAVLNAAAMMVAFPLIGWLNISRLPPHAQPGLLRRAGLVVAFGFFAFFLTILAKDQIVR